MESHRLQSFKQEVILQNPAMCFHLPKVYFIILKVIEWESVFLGIQVFLKAQGVAE